MRVLIAFDKFKNSLSAEEACAIAARVLASRYPDATLDICPLTDGGEGFASILTRVAGGRWEAVDVVGARGTCVHAGFGRVPVDAIPAAALDFLPADWREGDWVAIVEMASASGLAPLSPDSRDPWRAETTGTGELMAAAMRAGARAILLGVGGSATNDLGLGALRVLGIEAVEASGFPVVPPVPLNWARITGFRGSVVGGPVPVFIACDVSNPVLGPDGCSAVYGPQKGLQPGDLPAMETAVERMSGLLCDHCGKSRALVRVPGAGAAGGIAFGLMCAAHAHVIPGADLVAAWLDLGRRLALADIVITGEGRFDASSLQGKGPGKLIARSVAQGRPVHVFCGSASRMLEVPSGVVLHAVSPENLPLAEALVRGEEFLAKAVNEAPLGDRHSPRSGV